jgi:hypothetical protein
MNRRLLIASAIPHGGRAIGYNAGMSRLPVLAVLVTLLAGCPSRPPQVCPAPPSRPTALAPPSPAPAIPVRDASDDFFEQQSIPTIKIVLDPVEEQLLREDARRYVKAKLIENGETEYPNVAIKLKGAAGSFQELDGKPGFTLNAGKFQDKQRFHALKKFHLNNCVQDESFLSESLAGELCRDAGVPAARVTHARVWLNDRDLGLYVVKEGFDEGFLKRHFGDAKGTLFDGGFCTDIDAELEKDSGPNPDDRSELLALRAACQLPDLEQRWQQMEERLDVPAFLNFMALELMMCHWDGYTCNKNNYRVYFDASSGKARFLPHGMDQMFQDPGFPVLQYPGTIAAIAVTENPRWREQFRERVKELLPQFSAEALQARLDKLDQPLQTWFKSLGEEQAQQHTEVVRQFKERLVERARILREQITQPDPGPPSPPGPLEFKEEGIAEIGECYPHEPGDARIEPIDAEGMTQLFIQTGPSEQCLASWRQHVRLPEGRYRFEAKVRTAGVVPIVDEKGRGAGLRISGASRENHLEGDADWQMLHYDFKIDEPLRDVELVAELRATRGQMWIALPLRVVKLREDAP